MTNEEVSAIVDKWTKPDWTEADETRVIEKARVCNHGGYCYLVAGHVGSHVAPEPKASDVFAEAFDAWKRGY